MNTLHRREPGQNSEATHDRVHALADLQVRQAAIPVIADAAEAVVAKAREGRFAAGLRERADSSDRSTATADCHDYDNSPYPGPGGGCGPRF